MLFMEQPQLPSISGRLARWFHGKRKISAGERTTVRVKVGGLPLRGQVVKISYYNEVGLMTRLYVQTTHPGDRANGRRS